MEIAGLRADLAWVKMERDILRRGAVVEIGGWLGFCNHRRIHSSLGDVSPMQFERAWLAAQQRQAA